MATYIVTFEATADVDIEGFLARHGAESIVVKEKGVRNTGTKTAAIFDLMTSREPVYTRAQIADAAGASVARVAEVIGEKKMTHTPEQAQIVADYLVALEASKANAAAAKAAAKASADAAAKAAKVEAEASAKIEAEKKADEAAAKKAAAAAKRAATIAAKKAAKAAEGENAAA